MTGQGLKDSQASTIQSGTHWATDAIVNPHRAHGMAMSFRPQGQVAFLLLLEGGLGFSCHQHVRQTQLGYTEALWEREAFGVHTSPPQAALRKSVEWRRAMSPSQGCWSLSNLQEGAVKSLLVRQYGGYSASAQ